MTARRRHRLRQHPRLAQHPATAPRRWQRNLARCFQLGQRLERVNGRLKDEFGARQVRVRGHSKVLCHLMFGVLALTVDQLLRLVN